MICDFCYRHCNIEEGGEGFCHYRKFKDNRLYSSCYGYLDVICLDPVEKKPLYHFLPGTKTLSIAEPGCNFSCDFCQNWSLSQRKGSSNSTFVTPQQIVDLAILKKIPSISFTYSEPIVWQDYVIDTAIIAKNNGIRTIMVTNGSFSKKSRENIAPFIDAFNIDLKGDAKYYKTVCKSEIGPVLEGIEYMVKMGCHMEVTTLLIEGIHTATIIKKLGKALKDRGVEVWHLTRFFPNYKMSNRVETSEIFLSNMIDVAKESEIPYIYGGNSSLVYSTYCCKCKKKLISRNFEEFNVKNECNKNISNGKCIYCNNVIYGFFE